ncbi:unnamed protein product [Lactuca virosa]|uniref:Uncharacterized protein n=1 Tax=Lactuca virosa TaxID=75947 RepID=A0AAU9N6K4_9ASTR|nr:unnamed protein product [Lactuca virosa]
MSFLKKRSSKRALWEKLFCVRSPIPTTTAATPLGVIEPVFRAPIVSASDMIYVETLISSRDNMALYTPSEGMHVMSVAPPGSTMPKFDFIPVKNQAPLPTLMSLASFLPYFLHPYASTSSCQEHGVQQAFKMYGQTLIKLLSFGVGEVRADAKEYRVIFQ